MSGQHVSAARCACLKTDARYCLEWRTKDDMRQLLGDPSELDDYEVCECACHAEDEEFDDGTR